MSLTPERRAELRFLADNSMEAHTLEPGELRELLEDLDAAENQRDALRLSELENSAWMGPIRRRYEAQEFLRKEGYWLCEIPNWLTVALWPDYYDL